MNHMRYIWPVTYLLIFQAQVSQMQGKLRLDELEKPTKVSVMQVSW